MLLPPRPDPLLSTKGNLASRGGRSRT